MYSSLDEGKNILVIGAHPDDIELACLGTLCRWCKSNTVHVVVLTGKDLTVARESHDILSQYIAPQNLAYWGLASFGQLAVTAQNVRLLDEVVAKRKIDVIVSHTAWDTHQDHIAACGLARAITRRRPITLLGFHAISSTNDFEANLLVDITDGLEDKLEELTRFESYQDKDYFNPAWLRMWHHDKLATCVGLKYVEMFHIFQSFR